MYILFLSSKHEWTTWAACDQIFEVIQKIKEGEAWKAAAKKEDVEDTLKDQNIEKEDLWDGKHNFLKIPKPPEKFDSRWSF